MHLERIPGAAVDDALRKALSKAEGNAKVGIINTLGVRGDKKAVDALAKLTNDANETVAVAAVAALSRIDDKGATDAIAKAKDKATGAVKTAATRRIFAVCGPACGQRAKGSGGGDL